jgi:maltoporin
MIRFNAYFYSVFFIFFWIASNISIAEDLEPANDNFLSYFDIIGYTRIGTGQSSGGSTQARFQAPGATAGYRLGNEADIGLEVGINFSYPLDEMQTKRIEALYFVADYQAFGNENLFYRDPDVLQAYIRFEKVLRPDLNVWFGRTYYDRKFIYSNDHFWLNTAQGANLGAGIELETSVGELKIAAFQLKDDDDTLQEDIYSYSYDFRLLDIELNKRHKLNLFAEYVHRDGGDPLTVNGKPIKTDTKDGIGVAAWIDSKFSDNLTNTAAFVYRQGAAFRQSSFNPNPVREDQGFGLDDAHYWELNTNLVYDSDEYSLGWTAVIRSEDRGVANNSDIQWYSAGVQPIIYLTDNFNIAFEAGIDYVDNDVLDVSGQVSKFSVALQYSKSRGYYSRPVVRLFATKAYWSDDFEGLVGAGPGDAPFANDTDGLTFGIQFENWW